MPKLRFEGSSDDTFGETLHTREDYDNCASGEPIVFVVEHASGCGVIVSGQYGGLNNCAGWMIAVGSYDPEHMDRPLPPWPIRFTLGDAPYSPALLIEAPEDVIVRCLTAEEQK